MWNPFLHLCVSPAHVLQMEIVAMKNLVIGLLLALTTLSLAACNTVRGAGQDVEDAGEAVQDAAD
ncbi:hypothetical protein GCM10017621_17550 [Maricaulis virginensis]|uniref:Uncharacterized protein n=1 Tax=Maricaulis virginensis TaxID=144022 RepID=A0A9W6IL18_9PROT|nr:hypothetical protein GCM10017621_17550 [Maricaulis virginensis]